MDTSSLLAFQDSTRVFGYLSEDTFNTLLGAGIALFSSILVTVMVQRSERKKWEIQRKAEQERFEKQEENNNFNIVQQYVMMKTERKLRALDRRIENLEFLYNDEEDIFLNYIFNHTDMENERWFVSKISLKLPPALQDMVDVDILEQLNEKQKQELYNKINGWIIDELNNLNRQRDALIYIPDDIDKINEE